MAERVKLTAGRVRDFACPPDKSQAFLWDSDVPGLALRASPSGRKTYVFQGRMPDGKDARLPIGEATAWGIDGARDEARRLRALVDQGIDPRQAKAERIATDEAKRANAKRERATVLDAWQAYVAARSTTWGDRHKRDHERAMLPGGETITRGRRIGENDKTAPGMLRSLADLPLGELNRKAVAAWVQSANERGGTEAAKHFRLLRAFVRWCAESDDYAGVVQSDACAGRAVRDFVKRSTTHDDDCLQREMLKAWFEQVRKIANPVQSAYLQGLLLTGARREELAGLQWSDVDFAWKSLSIRDKIEGERVIPLTPFLASLLAALPRRTMTVNGETVANPYVFSSPTSKSGRLTEARIGHNKALIAAGLPALTIHGLRRSFATLSEWCEVPVGVVAQIQGHKPSAIAEKHYRRRPLDLLRSWHVKIEAWLLNEAGLVQPGEDAGKLRLVAA